MNLIKQKDGVGLLSAVITLAILGGLILSFGGIFPERFKVLRKLAAEDQFHQFGNDLARHLFRRSSDVMEYYAQKYCLVAVSSNIGTTAYFAQHWASESGHAEGYRLGLLTSVNSSEYQIETFETMNMDPVLVGWPVIDEADLEFNAMKVRCQVQTFNPDVLLNEESTGFYYCGVLMNPLGQPHIYGDLNSFLSQNEVFYEARFDLWNLQTNESVACKNFRDPLEVGEEGEKVREIARGGALQYALYWRKKGSTDKFISYAGTYFGSTK